MRCAVSGIVLGWLIFHGAAILLLLHGRTLMAMLAEVAALAAAGALWMLGASHSTTNERRAGEHAASHYR